MNEKRCYSPGELEPCEKCLAPKFTYDRIEQAEHPTIEQAIERDRIQAALYREKMLEGPPVINVSVPPPKLTREEVWLRVVCAVVRIEKVTIGIAVSCGDEAVKSFDKKSGVVKL